MDEDKYTTKEDTAELLRLGQMPKPLRLAAMLEQTMQSPLHGKAADCLREMYALLQAATQPAPVQEPVGYVAENGVVDWNVCAPPILTDLYTTPPAAQRQWVGLTDEEIEKACVPLGAAMLSFTEVARAIEAKLRSKNNG